jgi:hypothetical protein
MATNAVPRFKSFQTPLSRLGLRSLGEYFQDSEAIRASTDNTDSFGCLTRRRICTRVTQTYQASPWPVYHSRELLSGMNDMRILGYTANSDRWRRERIDESNQRATPGTLQYLLNSKAMHRHGAGCVRLGVFSSYAGSSIVLFVTRWR